MKSLIPKWLKSIKVIFQEKQISNTLKHYFSVGGKISHLLSKCWLINKMKQLFENYEWPHHVYSLRLKRRMDNAFHT